MRVLQILIAFLVGCLCVYAGVDHGFLIGIYMFIAAYGLTVWLPEVMGKSRQSPRRQ